MGSESSVLGVVIAVVGVVGSVLVARISNPRHAQQNTPPAGDAEGLRIPAEMWQRLTVLERTVDEQRDQIVELDRMLRQAVRLLSRANWRLRANRLPADPIPSELASHSLD